MVGYVCRIRSETISFIQYLIDFEVAIQFPADCSETERLSMGLPLLVAPSRTRKRMLVLALLSVFLPVEPSS